MPVADQQVPAVSRAGNNFWGLAGLNQRHQKGIFFSSARIMNKNGFGQLAFSRFGCILFQIIQPDRYNPFCIVQGNPENFILMAEAGFHRLFLEGSNRFAFCIIPTRTPGGFKFKFPDDFSGGLVKLVDTHPLEVHGV